MGQARQHSPSEDRPGTRWWRVRSPPKDGALRRTRRLRAKALITFTPGDGIEQFLDEFFRLARE
jgi:hypothetical protein